MTRKTKDQVITEKDKHIEELENEIRLLKVRLKHLENESALAHEEIEETTQKYLEILIDIEDSNQILSQKNRDIIEQKDRMANQYKFLQTLMDNIPNPIFYKDVNGVYMGCNRALLEAFGRTRDEVIGSTDFELTSRQVAERNKVKDRELVENQQVQRYETQVTFADGLQHDLIVNKAVFHNVKGKVSGFIGVIHDITEMKRAEMAIEESRQELMGANQAKDKLFSVIAHDLKSPLNAVLLNSEYLWDNFDSFNREKIKQVILRIQKGATRLSDQLNNLLMWARSQIGMITFSPRMINISKLTGDIAQSLQPLIDYKNLTFTTDIPDQLRVWADKKMVITVLRNLLTNAIKFTDLDGSIHYSARKLENGLVEFTVRDNGVGISPENLKKLFRIETHFSTKGTAGESGAGLGLLICKDFIEKNMGTITVENATPHGTVCRFTLPDNMPTALNHESSADIESDESSSSGMLK